MTIQDIFKVDRIYESFWDRAIPIDVSKSEHYRNLEKFIDLIGEQTILNNVYQIKEIFISPDLIPIFMLFDKFISVSVPENTVYNYQCGSYILDKDHVCSIFCINQLDMGSVYIHATQNQYHHIKITGEPISNFMKEIF